ncbi:MAG: tail fiber protein [Alphaproteobacteria bacterium]|nr:tail fiber protein [Alphaproteobacteria bacterium]
MDSPFTGMLAAFGFNFAPHNWGLCYGGIIAISQNQALFSLIGAAYGGDGRVSFGLPDLRGRSAVGWGQGPGLSNYILGQKVGQEMMTLSQSQLPTHTHTAAFTPSGGGGAQLLASTSAGTKDTPTAGDYLAKTAQGFDTYNTYTDTPGTTVALGGVSGGGGGGTVTVDPSGGSQAFWILQPFQVINWSICLFGLYPPRN